MAFIPVMAMMAIMATRCGRVGNVVTTPSDKSAQCHCVRVADVMVTSVTGTLLLPLTVWVGTAAMALTTSSPVTTLPKTA